MNPRLRRLAALVIFGAFAVLPLIASISGDDFLIVIATRILAFAIAALALDLILGYGGMVSFGHAAYLGIGAYAVAILSRAGITDLGAHLLVAMAAAVPLPKCGANRASARSTRLRTAASFPPEPSAISR